MRKKLVAVGAAIGVAALPLIAATPAAAAPISPSCATNPSPTNLTGDSFTFTPDNTCLALEWDPNSINPSEVTVTINGIAVIAETLTSFSPGATVLFNYTGSSSGLPIDLDFRGTGSPPRGPTRYSVFVTGSGGGGGGSSTSSSPAPRTETLSLMNEDSGTTCVNSSISGEFGTWVDLPSANDCTPPASKPGATLLGWATFPNFPVEIAQRQVDNGWGAYQTFNADEQLTGVFIPAGGPTELTAPGKLYPIWSE
jgi:hypothetical protein